MSKLLNLLVAYPYMSKGVLSRIKENDKRIRFLLDSGAFTAWKTKTEITLDGYCTFLEKLPIRPFAYIALDVIGDAKKTMQNYETMLKRGFNPIPVFTRGEDFSVLDHYFKTSEVVCIGGLVGTPRNKGFVKHLMKTVGERKVHLLGFTNFDFLKHYKPFSCDSSTWETGARYGQIPLYLGSGRPIVNLKKSEFKKIWQNDILMQRLQALGINPGDLVKKENWHGGRSIPRILGARSTVKMSSDIEKHLGTKLFAAAATDLAVDLLLEAL